MPDQKKINSNRIFVLVLIGLLTLVIAEVHANKKDDLPNQDVVNQSVKPNDPWNANQVITIKQFVKELKNKKVPEPVILQVGFNMFYNQGHIPGSIYVGAAERDKGIHLIKSELKKVKKNKNIVLYCGCCPWSDCPNIRPAFKVVKELGYKNAKVLYIPDNFVKDWAKKGYPVTK